MTTPNLQTLLREAQELMILRQATTLQGERHIVTIQVAAQAVVDKYSQAEDFDPQVWLRELSAIRGGPAVSANYRSGAATYLARQLGSSHRMYDLMDLVQLAGRRVQYRDAILGAGAAAEVAITFANQEAGGGSSFESVAPYALQECTRRARSLFLTPLVPMVTPLVPATDWVHGGYLLALCWVGDQQLMLTLSSPMGAAYTHIVRLRVPNSRELAQFPHFPRQGRRG